MLLNKFIGELSITKLIGLDQRATIRIQQACLVWRCWKLCAWCLDAKSLKKLLGLDMLSMMC